MDKIASQIADKVLQKLAEEEELPGYMAIRPHKLTEGMAGPMIRQGLLGAGLGALAGGFHGKIDPVAGILGGAGLGVASGAGATVAANAILNLISRANEQKILERGQLTPEQVQQHREMHARQGQS